MSKDFTWARIKSSNSALELWDLIEGSYPNQFPHLSKIFKHIHSLPTTSANVEQAFSVMKLFKNDLRNSLKEDTLQSLMFIHQKYKEGPIIITEEIYQRYLLFKQKLNEIKSTSSPVSQHVQGNLLETESSQSIFLPEDGNKDRNNVPNNEDNLKRNHSMLPDLNGKFVTSNPYFLKIQPFFLKSNSFFFLLKIQPLRKI